MEKVRLGIDRIETGYSRTADQDAEPCRCDHVFLQRLGKPQRPGQKERRIFKILCRLSRVELNDEG